MIKYQFLLIFIFHIVDANLYQFYNFSMNPELSQPSGSINYNNILFIKNNKRYTTFEIEKISSNNFGINIHYSPLNDFCHNNFEKNSAINCLKKYPNQWWCIYENCISSSINQIKYYPILFNEFIIKKEFELPYAY
jgi:hypothetical protein